MMQRDLKKKITKVLVDKKNSVSTSLIINNYFRKFLVKLIYREVPYKLPLLNSSIYLLCFFYFLFNKKFFDITMK